VNYFAPVTIEEVGVFGLFVELRRDEHLVADILQDDRQRCEILRHRLLSRAEQRERLLEPHKGRLGELGRSRYVRREIDLVGIPVLLNRISVVVVRSGSGLELHRRLVSGHSHPNRCIAVRSTYISRIRVFKLGRVEERVWASSPSFR